ncbi:hypothetical protein [uncultured Methanobacterium sp.]|uniref:DISARM anti-phage system protein DrmE domain-containing protein n=1 Tax=uncultured Methanobacterium sp. TaxID=176306 RepID=UPI002AA6E199|nr:hypothetical protein [uncultured Methanobacterium sp.]
MSPLTNFVLNIFLNNLENKKNLIITLPDNILRPIPLIAYLYARSSKKSVLIFTQKGGEYSNENILETHRINYYLLNYGDECHGEYIFSDVPLGIISKDSIKANVYFRRANRDRRRYYIKLQEENFLNSDKPKIFLDYEEKSIRITETIEKLITPDKSIEINSKIDLGLVIFENVDRFINSKHSSKAFYKWIKPLLEKKIQIIFHFSNTESKYIDALKNESNSFVLPLNHTILANESIKEKSLNYFNKIGKNREKMDLIEKYNIDKRTSYDKLTCREMLKPVLDSGNTDYHYNYSRILKKDIKESLLVDNILYYTILSFFYELPNIFINPSKYKKYYQYDGFKGHYTLYDLIKIFKEQNKYKENEVTINYLTSEISAVCNELSDCKRYGEEISFDRIGKDYRILDLILNENFCNNEDVIFATYSPFERNILHGKIESIHHSKIKIESINKLNKSAFDRTKTILVLPGPLRLKYFSELLRPYKKIFFLAYSGNNYNIIKEQINLVQDYSLKNVKSSLEYFSEVYDFMNIPKDALFVNHNLRVERDELVHEKSEDKINTTIKNIIDSISKYPLIGEYEKEMDELEKKNIYFKDKRANEIFEDSEGVEIVLKRFNKSNIVTKKLFLDKTYLYLKTIDGKFDEDTPDKLYEGCYVIVLDDNERKTLLELIIDISGMEESVDRELIEIWWNKLREFKKEQDFNVSQFQKYLQEHGIKKDKQTVRNWINGIVLGPQHPQDILHIGEAIHDNDLIADWNIIEQEIALIRQIHREQGKMLKKIIRNILNGDLNLSKMSYQELELYESIKDGIYEVKEIL